MSIKIAYLIDSISSDKAGTEKQLLEIIRRLNRDTFDPSLICLTSSPWLEQHELSCRHYELGYNGFIKTKFPGVVARLSRILRDERYNIMQTFFEDSIFVGFLGSLFISPRPTLLSSRRDMGLGKDDLWYHSFFKALLPLVNRGFEGIVANGSIVKEFVAKREKIDPKKIKVINNGISLPPEYIETPEIFNTIKTDIWIGITANLKPVKRIDLFLKGLAVFKERSSIDFHALILGEGTEDKTLRKMAQDFGLTQIVHFMGSVNNVYAYLKHLDIGVLCSDREGFSNAIMEYMACGLPVVATSVGGNIELVDESNGIVIPAGDGEVLGNALAILADHPELRKTKGMISLGLIKERYAWDRIIAEWESYYLSLVSEIT